MLGFCWNNTASSRTIWPHLALERWFSLAIRANSIKGERLRATPHGTQHMEQRKSVATTFCASLTHSLSKKCQTLTSVSHRVFASPNRSVEQSNLQSKLQSNLDSWIDWGSAILIECINFLSLRELTAQCLQSGFTCCRQKSGHAAFCDVSHRLSWTVSPFSEVLQLMLMAKCWVV